MTVPHPLLPLPPQKTPQKSNPLLYKSFEIIKSDKVFKASSSFHLEINTVQVDYSSCLRTILRIALKQPFSIVQKMFHIKRETPTVLSLP